MTVNQATEKSKRENKSKAHLFLPFKNKQHEKANSKTNGNCKGRKTSNGHQCSKVAGPASFTIRNSSSAKTIVKDLKEGTYQFELKVTDVLPQKIKSASAISVNNTIDVAGGKANGILSNQINKLRF